MTAADYAAGFNDAGEPETADLFAAAARGDQAAWDRLVGRHAGLVWAIARGYGLNEADAADVAQTVWLRLVESLRSLRDPAQLPAWLATVTRRESLQLLRRRGREVVEDASVDEPVDLAPSPERQVLMLESREQLWAALGRLPGRCQALLRALVAVAEVQYAQVAEALGVPIGSIGPTRQRCLHRLRRELAAAMG